MKKSVNTPATSNVNTSNVNSQLSTIHEGLIQNGRVVLRNDESFGNFKADNSYEYNGIKFKCTEIVTKGLGNHTLIKLVREDTNEIISGDIDDIKNYFGVTFKKKYNTKAKTPEGRIYVTVTNSEFRSLIEEVGNPDLTKYWQQFYALAKILEDEKKAKIEAEEKAREKKEKETKKVARVADMFKGLTPEQQKAILKELGL